jgi:hypothetical protein
VRLPPPGWRPGGHTPASGPGELPAPQNVTADRAVKTLPFWLLWAVLFLNVTAGIGVLGQASPMIQEMFPGRVSSAAAAGFVGVAKALGRVKEDPLSKVGSADFEPGGGPKAYPWERK